MRNKVIVLAATLSALALSIGVALAQGKHKEGGQLPFGPSEKIPL